MVDGAKLTAMTLLRNLALCTVAAAVTAACGSADTPSATADSEPSGPVACTDLAGYTDSRVAAMAEYVAAGGFEPPAAAAPAMGAPVDFAALPGFCRVAGTISPVDDSRIGFELWIPASGWNGKLLQVGNGGAAGNFVYGALAEGLQRGYAVANTDTGHRGAMGDFSWAAGQPESVIDYAWRAVHETAVASRDIVTTHFATAPRRSYWYGCSTGGRQGLMAAQRFADDFDAIVAGAPASHFGALMALSIHIGNRLGPGGLAVEKLGLLKSAAIAACDETDGVADGVIGEPARCEFDPGTLQCAGRASSSCLSAAEVAAARELYAGVVNTAGETLYPGTGFGSEPLWAAYAAPPFRIGESFFRHVVMRDARWSASGGFNVEEGLALARAAGVRDIEAVNPDLAAFLSRGGKLLLYHGTTDGLIPHAGTEDYFRRVLEAGGERAARQVRYFAVPGMDHCSGGDGAHEVDWLGELERWDEGGAAPEVITARHSQGEAPFSRPLCAWPHVARYSGSGDESDAANWRCTAP